MVAQLVPPPSLPAKSEFFLVMAWGLIARSTLDDVGVELDAAVGQEALEDGATRDGVADRLGELRFAGDPRQGLLPEGEELGDDRGGGLLTHRDTCVRALAAHGLLDLPELRHPLDRLRCDLRAFRDMQLIELAPTV